MAFILLSVRLRVRAELFIQMPLTSKTVIPFFSEGIIKPLVWGFKCLAISNWCISFSNITETGNCQGKPKRPDPVFLYFFILLFPNISHLPCSSWQRCFWYLGNKGKLMKEILAYQQAGDICTVLRNKQSTVWKDLSMSPQISQPFRPAFPWGPWLRKARVWSYCFTAEAEVEGGPTEYRRSLGQEAFSTAGAQGIHTSLWHAWQYIFIITGLKLKENPNRRTWAA